MGTAAEKTNLVADDEQYIEVEVLNFGGIRIDFGTNRITVNDRPIDLSLREVKLLAFFIRHLGRVYSRDQLLDCVGSDESHDESRTVDVHVSRLRTVLEKKDNPQYIPSGRGIGCKFRDSPSCET